MRVPVGLLEWFRVGEHDRVEEVLRDLAALKVAHLRTGVSWADYHASGGREWYRWLLPRLSRDVEVLPCFVHTPPSLGIRPKTSSPPRRPRDYADWIDVMITECGECFEHVELWNEPNNLSEWDWTLDANWGIFCEMIGAAAYWARRRGKKTVLGGMAPIDANWLGLMSQRGVLEHIDVVGVHGFPALWEAHWRGWASQLQPVRDTIAANKCKCKLWITETGYSTWRFGEFEQLESFLEAIEAPAERVYWYAAHDLHPDHKTIDGFHCDEREYHLGIKDYCRRPKLLYRAWADGGEGTIRLVSDLSERACVGEGSFRSVLITGGAGFIGARLASALAGRGQPVIIYDNLSRPGADINIQRLKKAWGGLIECHIADVRNFYSLREAVSKADTIFHLAAEPEAGPGRPPLDFDVNLRGTINLLEAIRAIRPCPALITASTVAAPGEHGLCVASRAAADGYVQHYARFCGIGAVVLRFGGVYGHRGAGIADETFPAADGRDFWELLHVEDAVAALLSAAERISALRGEIYDVTGGEENVVVESDLARLLHANGVESHFGVSGAPVMSDGCETYRLITGRRPTPLVQGLRELCSEGPAVEPSTATKKYFEKGGRRARSRG